VLDTRGKTQCLKEKKRVLTSRIVSAERGKGFQERGGEDVQKDTKMKKGGGRDKKASLVREGVAPGESTRESTGRKRVDGCVEGRGGGECPTVVIAGRGTPSEAMQCSGKRGKKNQKVTYERYFRKSRGEESGETGG